MTSVCYIRSIGHPLFASAFPDYFYGLSLTLSLSSSRSLSLSLSLSGKGGRGEEKGRGERKGEIGGVPIVRPPEGVDKVSLVVRGAESHVT